MATKNPRVNVMLEPGLFQALGRYAQQDHVSLSSKIKELIIRALEDLEDRDLSKMFDERAKTFRRKDALTHEQLLKKTLK